MDDHPPPSTDTAQALDRWLRDEVAPIHDAMQADPARGRSADQVADRLRAHHAARSKALPDA